MELAVKLHVFCRNNQLSYKMCYESNAICWSQAPHNLRDVGKQRRRWHLGLFQCMLKYRAMFVNLRFGFVSLISYMYYLFYELLSPVIEVFWYIYDTFSFLYRIDQRQIYDIFLPVIAFLWKLF